MANRFPLIANAADSKVYELASGDNLDLTGSGIANSAAVITLPTVTSTLATLAGTETLTNKTIDLTSNTLVMTSAQLAAALTDETGTGANVFGTSPAITTSLTTPSTTFALVNTTATTVNFAGAATALSIGASTGTSTVNNALSVAGSLTRTGNISAAAWGTGGAGLKLPYAIYTDTSSSGTVAGPTAIHSIAGTNIVASSATTYTNLATLYIGNAPTLGTNASATNRYSLYVNQGAYFAGDINTGATVNFAASATSLSIGASTGTTTINNDTVITGNLTVNGTTTTVNSTTLNVDDIMIELGAVTTPTDTTANGGGITLLGATNKTITWDSANGNWTSNQDWNIVTGKAFKINNVSVLNATTLGSSVVTSSLTSVGTIATGTWQGTVIGSTYGGTGVNNGSATLTMAGSVTHAGSFTQSFTATGNTAVTLPTTGTLATLAGSETLTNKTLTAPTITTMTYAGTTLSNAVTGTGSMVLSASPTFTGVPIAPTATQGTNTTQVATTAFAIAEASAAAVALSIALG